jgi:c-di-GMP-binding flagellar brake protein YcgR
VLTIPTVVNAEVLDISAGGALVSTPANVAPGHRCQLRALLDREPFSALVEVLRVEEGTRNGLERRHHVGLRFGGLDDNSRRTLQRFVKDDGKAH